MIPPRHQLTFHIHLLTLTIIKQKKKKNQITPFQSNLLEQLKKNQEMTSSPDMIIVMSFLPYLKLLNDEQKLEFHLNSLQYLKNIIKYQYPPVHQNVLHEPPHQYPVPTTPIHLNNYNTMNQNLSSNMNYNSSSYSSTQIYPYSYPAYTQPNYTHHSSSSAHSDNNISTTLTPTSQPLPSNHKH
jgi:hypothetical protein